MLSFIRLSAPRGQAVDYSLKHMLGIGLVFIVVLGCLCLLGCAESSAGTLNVRVPPSITTQPAGQQVTVGQTATFSVVATGTEPLKYQWVRNGTAIKGATVSSYTTPPTTASDSGAQFGVWVSNPRGSVSSSAAVLTVNGAPVAPSITTQPAGQTVTAGQTAAFSVVAMGTAPLSYQWRKNGTAISGATAATYTTPVTTTTDNGAQFSVVVSNPAGSVTSSAANLTVNAATAQLTGSPSSLSMGNVIVGSTSTLAVTLTNVGSANVTISNVFASGAGFTASGVSAGQILTPGQTAALNVTFAPATAGSVTGNISVASNAINSPTTIPLSGTGVQPQLSLTPSSASFGDVVVGTTNTQPIRLTNSGTADLTISQATVSGSGFTTSGLTLPLTLSLGQSTNLDVAFAPASAGSVTGSVVLVSNAPNSPTTIPLSGRGVDIILQLAADLTSLNFGSVTVGSSSTQTVTLTNTGNSDLNISQINVSGAGFSASGLVPPLTLMAGQTATFDVAFSPTTSGAVSGSVTVVSNATNSPASIPLAGSGAQAALAVVFPGFQGSGAVSVGGRGGTVCAVTTLADSGAGSLRDCVGRSGPRTVVFRVGGTINLLSQLRIPNPYITIAGQTAPGGGITLRGDGVADDPLRIDTHDVIIQYIRSRVGLGSQPAQTGDGAAIYQGVYNVMIDHVSLSWTTDENFQIWSNGSPSAHHITLSNSLLAEPLRDHAVSVITGAANSSLAAASTDIDFHHNLWANTSHRNPLVKTGGGWIVNNIIYNYSFRATQGAGGGSWDIVGNRYKAGPLTSTSIREINWVVSQFDAPTGNPSLYVAGNAGPHIANPDADNWNNIVYEAASENGTPVGVLSTSYKRTQPKPPPTYAITVDQVNDLDSLLLSHVGASRHLDCSGNWVTNRDAVDARIVNEYNSNQGIVPINEEDVGGFPTIANGIPCVDIDNDGIPDLYEIALGLNPNNALDAQLVAVNGFTNLEIFLHGAPPATASTYGPYAIPGRIEAENYKSGGPNVGYYDTTTGNSGGTYRNDDVDIEPNTDAGLGFNVGWTAQGEWLAYSISVSQTGSYTITARVASGDPAGSTDTMHLTLDGAVLGSPVSFPSTGGWQNWIDVSLGTVTLPQGIHELRFHFDTPSFTFNYLDIRAVP